MSPTIKNMSNFPQTISDLNVALRGANDKFGGNTAIVSEEQIEQSIGVQTLLARGVLEVLGKDALKDEAIRRAELANELDRSRVVPDVENLHGTELLQNDSGEWVDPDAPHSFGGHELPKSPDSVTSGGKNVNPPAITQTNENYSPVQSPHDPSKMVPDVSQKVPDMGDDV